MEACGQVNCNFWSKKIFKKISVVFFLLKFLVIKPWIQIHIQIPLKCWVRIRIQIRIQWIRIHNSEWKVALIMCFQSRSFFHLQKTNRIISQRYVALIIYQTGCNVVCGGLNSYAQYSRSSLIRLGLVWLSGSRQFLTGFGSCLINSEIRFLK